MQRYLKNCIKGLIGLTNVGREIMVRYGAAEIVNVEIQSLSTHPHAELQHSPKQPRQTGDFKLSLGKKYPLNWQWNKMQVSCVKVQNSVAPPIYSDWHEALVIVNYL